MRTVHLVAAWVLGVALLALPAAAQNTGGYRGPQGNGIYPARELLKSWPPKGPQLLWKHYVGIGFAGATVVNDRVYITGGGMSSLYEFDLDGQLLQQLPHGTATWKRFTGTRSQVVVAGNIVVTTTPNGNVYAIDLEAQSIRWMKNVWRDFGSGKGKQGWGMPESPLLVDRKVIFNPVSRDDETPPIVAVDVGTGEIVWQADPEKGRKFSAGDVSGACFTHNGRKIVAWPAWRSFLVLDAETGKKLWEFPDPPGSEKTLAPVYNEGYLLTMPQGKFCRMVKLSADGASFTPLWERPFRGGFSQAVILGGRVYLFGDANDKERQPTKEGEDQAFPPLPRGATAKPVFMCLDAETGAAIQTYPSAEPGHVIAADGMVYTVEKLRRRGPKGEYVIPRVRLILPRPAGFEITGQFIPELTEKEMALRDIEWEGNAALTIAEGRLFLRYGPLMCFDLRADPPSQGWRGDGTGLARFARPVSAWSPERDAAWTLKLPGGGGPASGLVLAGERAFVLVAGKLLCVDTKAGKVAWQAEVGASAGKTPPPTPLVCQDAVYAVGHDGKAACFGVDGRQHWTAAVEPHPATGMASPLLRDGVLVLQGKALLGLAPLTGETLWTAALPDDVVCGSPVAARLNQWNGRAVVLTSAGMMVQAADGQVVGRYNAKDRSAIPAIGLASPVLANGAAWYCGNRVDGSGASAGWFAPELPEKERRAAMGRSLRTHKDLRLVGSAVVFDGLAYALTDKHELAVFDQTGALVYRQALLPEGETPAADAVTELWAAGGCVYAAGLGRGGHVVLVRPGREFGKVGQWQLPATSVGLAFDGPRLLVRAGDTLHALVNKAPLRNKPVYPTTLPWTPPATRPATQPAVRGLSISP